VGEVLAREPAALEPGARLVGDLGADSLDLVELMYVLEQEFGVRFDKADLSLSGQLGLPEEETHRDEVLTERALELLREQHPDGADALRPGTRRQDLAGLLTVAAVARSVDRKLASAGTATVAASPADPRC
jgi:acyl carrier protein